MNEFVTIPREEYDALIADRDMLADVSAFDRAKAELASGDDELVPSEFANRIMDGESAVRVFREMRGLSGADLARMTGMHRVQVSDIETGKSKGSVDTLGRLAAALGVAIDDLI